MLFEGVEDVVPELSFIRYVISLFEAVPGSRRCVTKASVVAVAMGFATAIMRPPYTFVDVCARARTVVYFCARALVLWVLLVGATIEVGSVAPPNIYSRVDQVPTAAPRKR